MKKLFISLSMAALATVTAGAQQLTNAGFESDWGSMACWSAGTFADNGEAPAPWKTSNVGTPSVAKSVVSEKATGYQSESALKVFNRSVLNKVVPGYFTLGQPWSTALGTSGKNADGGTFGGIDFTYRPDAVSFMYQSSGSAQPTCVAYAWKGTYTQADVPANIVVFGSCKTVTMTDRDRNILGMSTSQGGSVTASDDAELIASVTARLDAATSGWTAGEAVLDYKTASTPSKFNLIFAADDYFSSTPSASNELTVDDVKLLYYSRLASVSVNGTPVAGFDSKTYSYDLSDTEMPAESAISYTLLGNSGGSTATVKTDEANARVEITVTRSDAACTDYDDAATHTYVLQFKAAGEDPGEGTAVTYTGVVSILANEYLGTTENIDRNGKVTITTYSNGTCTFLLPDFALGDSQDEYIGDIEVKNVKTTTNGDITSYEGVTKALKLSLGGAEIVANVSIEGTTNTAGDASMKIHVVWLSDPEGDPEGEYGVPIEVEFNGKNTSAIHAVETDNSAAAVEYYNIQGMRVNPENLTPGLYIRRQGTDVKKIYLK